MPNDGVEPPPGFASRSARTMCSTPVNGCLPTHVSFAAEHVQFEQRPWYHALPELLGKPDNDALVRGWGEFQGQREVMTPKASPGNMKICREPFLSNQ